MAQMHCTACHSNVVPKRQWSRQKWLVHIAISVATAPFIPGVWPVFVMRPLFVLTKESCPKCWGTVFQTMKEWREYREKRMINVTERINRKQREAAQAAIRRFRGEE